MSIGWYLDADGVTHTFHAIDGWTQWSLHDGGEIPSDDFLLGIVDGELLSWALRRVAELGEPSQVHVGLRMNGESITICAISGGSSRLFRLTWESGLAEPLEVSMDGVSALDFGERSGPVPLYLYADRDWRAHVIARRDVEGEWWLGALRRDVVIGKAYDVDGELASHAVVDRDALVELLGRVGDGVVTLAFAPDKVIVRNGTGLVGTVPISLQGDPVSLQLDALPLAAGLRAATPWAWCRVLQDQDPPRILVRDLDENNLSDFYNWFSQLSTGWVYK